MSGIVRQEKDLIERLPANHHIGTHAIAVFFCCVALSIYWSICAKMKFTPFICCWFSEYRAELYIRLENRRQKQLTRRNRKANETETGPELLEERKVRAGSTAIKNKINLVLDYEQFLVSLNYIITWLKTLLKVSAVWNEVV